MSKASSDEVDETSLALLLSLGNCSAEEGRTLLEICHNNVEMAAALYFRQFCFNCFQ